MKYNIQLVVMNNLLPQTVHMHHIFDLKGTIIGRVAEKKSSNPTLRDLDFNRLFPRGLLLDENIHNKIMDVIKRDCRVTIYQPKIILNIIFLLILYYVVCDV